MEENKPDLREGLRQAWKEDISPLVEEVRCAFNALSHPAKIAVASTIIGGYLLLNGMASCTGWVANRAAGRNEVYESDYFSNALKEEGVMEEKAEPYIEADVCTGTNEYACANTIKELMDAGVPADTARKFKDRGILQTDTIITFFQMGTEPEQAAPYFDQTICRKPPQWEINDYINAGITAETVGGFQKIGISDWLKIKRFASGNLRPAQVQEYQNAGIHDLDDMITYGSAQLTPAVIANYTQNGITNVQDIVTFSEGKVSPMVVKEYLKAEITSASAIVEYHQRGITPAILRTFGEAIDSIADSLSEENIPFPHVLPYLIPGMCVPDNCFLELSDYIQAGVAPQTVLEYKKVGIPDSDDIIDFVKEKIPADIAASYQAIGIRYSFQMTGLIKAGISAERAKVGLARGCKSIDMQIGQCAALRGSK